MKDFAGEFGVPHASEQAARAAHLITKGPYKGWFWGGATLAQCHQPADEPRLTAEVRAVLRPLQRGVDDLA